MAIFTAGTIRYESKSDIVCALLRELIISGELGASEPLRQRELAQRFGVSQTPVREALRRLESEGLVVNDAHRGATVAASRKGDVEDNALIRASLEPLAVQLAAGSITAATLDRLQQINDEMADNVDNVRRYGQLNREFHFSIYEAAGSPVLLSMMRLLWQAMPAGPMVQRARPESVRQHQAIIHALRRGHGDVAAEIMREHIASSEHLHEEIASRFESRAAARST